MRATDLKANLSRHSGTRARQVPTRALVNPPSGRPMAADRHRHSSLVQRRGAMARRPFTAHSALPPPQRARPATLHRIGFKSQGRLIPQTPANVFDSHPFPTYPPPTLHRYRRTARVTPSQHLGLSRDCKVVVSNKSTTATTLLRDYGRPLLRNLSWHPSSLR